MSFTFTDATFSANERRPPRYRCNGRGIEGKQNSRSCQQQECSRRKRVGNHDRLSASRAATEGVIGCGLSRDAELSPQPITIHCDPSHTHSQSVQKKIVPLRQNGSPSTKYPCSALVALPTGSERYQRATFSSTAHLRRDYVPSFVWNDDQPIRSQYAQTMVASIMTGRMNQCNNIKSTNINALQSCCSSGNKTKYRSRTHPEPTTAVASSTKNSHKGECVSARTTSCHSRVAHRNTPAFQNYHIQGGFTSRYMRTSVTKSSVSMSPSKRRILRQRAKKFDLDRRMKELRANNECGTRNKAQRTLAGSLQPQIIASTRRSSHMGNRRTTSVADGEDTRVPACVDGGRLLSTVSARPPSTSKMKVLLTSSRGKSMSKLQRQKEDGKGTSCSHLSHPNSASLSPTSSKRHCVACTPPPDDIHKADDRDDCTKNDCNLENHHDRANNGGQVLPMILDDLIRGTTGGMSVIRNRDDAHNVGSQTAFLPLPLSTSPLVHTLAATAEDTQAASGGGPSVTDTWNRASLSSPRSSPHLREVLTLLPVVSDLFHHYSESRTNDSDRALRPVLQRAISTLLSFLLPQDKYTGKDGAEAAGTDGNCAIDRGLSDAGLTYVATDADQPHDTAFGSSFKVESQDRHQTTDAQNNSVEAPKQDLSEERGLVASTPTAGALDTAESGDFSRRLELIEVMLMLVAHRETLSSEIMSRQIKDNHLSYGNATSVMVTQDSPQLGETTEPTDEVFQDAEGAVNKKTNENGSADNVNPIAGDYGKNEHASSGMHICPNTGPPNDSHRQTGHNKRHETNDMQLLQYIKEVLNINTAYHEVSQQYISDYFEHQINNIMHRLELLNNKDLRTSDATRWTGNGHNHPPSRQREFQKEKRKERTTKPVDAEACLKIPAVSAEGVQQHLSVVLQTLMQHMISMRTPTQSDQQHSCEHISSPFPKEQSTTTAVTSESASIKSNMQQRLPDGGGGGPRNKKEGEVRLSAISDTVCSFPAAVSRRLADLGW